MIGSVAVIRSVQRAHYRRSGSSRSGDNPHAARKVDVETREQVLARNAELPRVEGELVEKSRSLLGGESEHLRWVVLENKDATLSIWEKQPLVAVGGSIPHDSGSQVPGKLPRKVYSLNKLMEVDSNPSFLRLFLRFEGSSLCLAAACRDDFSRWMNAFSAYDMNSTGEVVPLERGCREKKLPGLLTCSLQHALQKYRDIEPTSHHAQTKTNPQSLSIVHGLEDYQDTSPFVHANTFEGCRPEEYDPGSAEVSAIQSSMGMVHNRKELCKVGLCKVGSKDFCPYQLPRILIRIRESLVPS